MMTPQEMDDCAERHGDSWTAYVDWAGEEYASEEGYREAYQGQYPTERDFAEELSDAIDLLGEVREDSILARYFDWDAWTRDLFLGEYYRDSDGHVFRID